MAMLASRRTRGSTRHTVDICETGSRAIPATYCLVTGSPCHSVSPGPGPLSRATRID